MNLKNWELDHINIMVPDLEATIKFYIEVMGFKIKERYKKGMSDFVFISDGKITYEILESRALEDAIFDHVAYVSKDIEADYKYFESIDKNMILDEIAYIDFLFENGVYYFFIKGECGELIEFCQRKA